MVIKRDRYLNQIVAKKKDGMIKIVTGIGRCGKSYLLNVLFRQDLLEEGVEDHDIIMLALDEDVNIRYRNLLELGKHIRELCADRSRYSLKVRATLEDSAFVINKGQPNA